MAAEAVGSWLRDRPAARDELRELVGVLSEQVSAPPSVAPVADWPLVLHRHYMRREILTACGIGDRITAILDGHASSFAHG